MCKYEKSRVARVIIFENANRTTWGHPREKPRGPIAHIIIMYIVTRLCGLFFKRINTMRPRAYRYVPFTYYYFSRKHFYATERKGFWCLLCYYCYVHADTAQCTFHVSTLFFFFEQYRIHLDILLHYTHGPTKNVRYRRILHPRVETICLRGRNASYSLENNKFDVNNWLRSVLWPVAIEKRVLKEHIVSLAGFDVEILSKV